MRVQVYIPHYFREHANPGENPYGYGSLRSGARLQRSIALSRCISELLNLRKYKQTCILNHHKKRIDTLENKEEGLDINITICTDGKNYLRDVIDIHRNDVVHTQINTDNPRNLPLLARDLLIKNSGNYDLYSYLEDDIIIHDSLYFEKQAWFINKTNSEFTLMPHRYERIDQEGSDVILVDGMLRKELVELFQETTPNIGNGMFLGKEFVSFDMATNPHSGTFTINKKQRDYIANKELPNEGFIGPLETAATLTPMKFFKILKTSYQHWRFMCVEHGHSSFRHYTKTLPCLALD